MKPRFNPYEEKIIKCLYQYSRPMTLNEIAQKTTLGWGTIKIYIKKLHQRKIVMPTIDKKWYLNY